MKILKTSKLFAKICYNNLRNVPPKEFPNVEEMENSQAVVGILKEKLKDFIPLQKILDPLTIRINNGEKVEPSEIVEMSTKLRMMDESYTGQAVEITFEDAQFNTFFQEFERWGKNWFGRVDDFLLFRKEMSEANSQPKGK